MAENLKDISREDAFLILNGIGKLGPVSVRKLLLAYENDPRRILSASRSSLLSVDGVGKAMVDSIKSSENEKWLKNEKLKLKKRGITFIIENSYPELLKQIYDPPLGLYLSGIIPVGPYISIVGTRQPSLY